MPLADMTEVAPHRAAAAPAVRRGPPEPIGYAVAVVLAVLAGGVAASGTGPDAATVGLARAFIVGMPLVVGFYAWRSDLAGRFGLGLMLTGAVWFVAVFAESESAAWYTLGRAAGWAVEVLLVYLALAFPFGRLTDRADRWLVGAMAVVVATLYLPQLLLAEQLQVPSPYTSCTGVCPANVLFALDSEPSSLVAGLRSTGALLVFIIDLAVVVVLSRRIARSCSVTRRMLTPVAAIMVARATVMGVAIVARQVDPDAVAIEAAAWALALGTPALAIAVAIGLGRFRLFAGRVLQDLGTRIGTLPDAIALQRALGRAFGDPSLRLAFPRAGSRELWRDGAGRPVVMPWGEAGRWIVEVRDRDTVVAAMICDEHLKLQPALVEAAAALAAVTLDNRRLAADAAASLHELEASRTRLATSAERERRRIERDLHDGAQQRLVALRIELELAEELVGTDPQAGRERLRALEGDVDDALEDLRGLAHGVYPPVLADRGLAEALRAVAMRSPVRVEVESHEVGRYAPELESAVYFCVLEALQNALKHAKGLRRVVLELDGSTPAQLRFVVRDDGAGIPPGDSRPAGAGITSMRDRVAAFGGRLDISSAPRVGTTVRGLVTTDYDGAMTRPD
jgi:signal transduction histidine kinase